MTAAFDVLANTALEKGCFLRREAITLGIDDKALARARRAGHIVRIRQGCYVMGDVWRAARQEARLVMRTLAAVRTAEGPVAASHTGSCGLQEIDLYGVDYERAHVTRLDGGAGRVDPSATHHEGLCVDQDLVVVRGVDATAPARAVLETASLHGVEAGLVAADCALRKKLTDVDELRRYQALMERWPNSQALRLVTSLADGRSGSAGESRSRYMMWAYGLPKPDLQFEVYDNGTLVGVSDFYWEQYNLLGEFDGQKKYGRLLKDDEDPGEVVFSEKQREDMLRDLTGCRMVRWVWHELAVPRVTCARIQRSMRSGAAEGRRLGA